MSKDSVIVAGDVTIDWLIVPVDAGIQRRHEHCWPNPMSAPGARLVARPGGAMLLAQFLGSALSRPTVSYSLDRPARVPASQVTHALLELDRFPASVTGGGRQPDVYRVRRRFGRSDPDARPAPLMLSQDDPHEPVIVLADHGEAFRDAENAWPAALTAEGAQPIVILDMWWPLAQGKLWDTLMRRHADRLVVVVDADDLRVDANVSRGLSWERTAMEFSWQMASNPRLMPLANCAHLIVRFGLDGVIRYTRAGAPPARLYYDPVVAEGGFRDEHPGEMIGCTYAFVASLAASIARRGVHAIDDELPAAMRSARRLLRLGFGEAAGSVTTVPDLFGESSPAEKDRISQIDVPVSTGSDTADPDFWSILSTLSSRRLEQIAYDIVRKGGADALSNVPVGRFGGLKTIDRVEIESFRSIRRLMLVYCATENPGRPLSIAVFGPPGSGKSFGVTQVAQSVAPGRIKKQEFNLSQFRSPDDLMAAFHWVRDVALSGLIALAVFDEFDSSLEGSRLGWLKSFLAPMQDGVFKEGEALHPIGRAIFVFAGGTSSTYEEFCCGGADTAAEAIKAFRDAKGPDFASRLRGYVNVLGPNPVGDEDRFSLVRRAVLLRSLLERKTPQLLDEAGVAQIDRGVLRALIKVPRYRHGARSMEAILDMSMLIGRRTFDQAALPPVEQLALHTDPHLFSRLVSRDVLFGAARERLARAIHEKYRRDQKDHKPDDDPAMRPWEELHESLRESNRQQGDDIPQKLSRIGRGFAPIGNSGPSHSDSSAAAFTAAEIEILAEMEHDRFVAERLAQGWALGDRDPAAKRSPHLVPWSELSEEIREYDRNAVRLIPALMAEAGFEIYRLE